MNASAVRPSALTGDLGYRRLKEYLVEATGLAFYLDKDAELGEKIAKRLDALRLASCSDYLALLHDGPAGETELDELIADLTIGETYFFRFEEHFQALRRTIVPDLIRRNASRRQIRIWSAGCSFGAEPYSLTMLLRREFGGELAGWDVSVIGTDINRRFLARAREGCFGDWALRGMDPLVKASCFESTSRGYQVREAYREGVSFQYHNLVRHPYPSLSHNLAAFDSILCRNVLIYFGLEGINRCVDQFWSSLVEGGWLLVGHAEVNPDSFRAYRVVDFPGAVLFQRAEGTTRAGPPPDEGLWGASPATPLPWQPLTLPPPPDPPGPAPWQALPPPPAPPVPATTRAATGGPSTARIRELADRAQWTEAGEICRALIAQDRLDPLGHFYQALVLEQMGQRREADVALNRAIYLDRTFVLAHYHRGLLLQKGQDLAGAARAFRNVLDLLAALEPETKLAEGDGISAEALRELAQMQLEVLGGAVRNGHVDWEALKRTLAEGERKLAEALILDESSREALLRKRADALAVRKNAARAMSAPEAVLVFQLGPESYALGLRSLAQVVPVRDLVPVAGAPARILGVMNLRGEVGTVWNLARVLALPAGEPPAGGHVLILKPEGEVGLRVDHVEGSRDIDLAALIPPGAAAAAPGYLRGLTPDGIHLLDIDAIRSRSNR